VRKAGELFYILGDHLGSTSIVTDANGTKVSEIRYRAASLWDKAWGEVRYESGASPTEYTYTGQYSYTADFGLMFYNARWYDPGISHFTQPDTIVPDSYNPLDWNRYSYVRYNPLKYTDPSGHDPACGPDGIWCGYDGSGYAGGTGSKGGGGNSNSGSSNGNNENVFSSHDGEHNIGSGASSNTDDMLQTLNEIEELFNWSLTTPGEIAIFTTPGYPYFSGARLFYQPFFGNDNASQVTIGPTFIGAGPVTVGFNGAFRYKQEWNSITALGYSPSWNFQPWAFKINMDTTLRTGDVRATHRIGAEFTARPDNLAYVPILVSSPLIAYAIFKNPQMVNSMRPALQIR